MKNKKIMVVLCALLLALSALVAGCGPGDGDTEANYDPEVLRIATFYDVITLDPQGLQTTGTNLLKVNIFENLIIQNDDGSFSPELAESWEQLDDNSYKFNLRQDVSFSNGSPMTAEDVLFTLERAAESPQTAALANMIDYENSEILDDHTIVVKMHYSFAPLLAHLAQEPLAIVCKSVVEANPENFDDEVVGTGPYKVGDWVRDSHLKMVENELYWGEKPKIPSLLFRVITEGSTRSLELEAGSVDLVLDLQPSSVQEMEGNKGIVVDITGNYYNEFISLNWQRPELADVNVRRAINCALDKQSIIDAAYEGLTKKLDSFICSGVWGYNGDVETYAYDVQRAKDYLAASAYPDGFELKITIANKNEFVTLAEIIKNQLEAIGLQVSVEVLDSAQFYNVLYTFDYDMAYTLWVAVAGDPDYGLYPVFHSTMADGGNQAHVNDPRVDELLELGRGEFDPELRKAHYADLQEYLADIAVNVPVCELVNINAYQSYVKGFVNDPNKFYHFKTVYFED